MLGESSGIVCTTTERQWKMESANDELANASHTPFYKRGRDRSSDEIGLSQTTCAQYTSTAASHIAAAPYSPTTITKMAFAMYYNINCVYTSGIGILQVKWK